MVAWILILGLLALIGSLIWYGPIMDNANETELEYEGLWGHWVIIKWIWKGYWNNSRDDPNWAVGGMALFSPFVALFLVYLQVALVVGAPIMAVLWVIGYVVRLIKRDGGSYTKGWCVNCERYEHDRLVDTCSNCGKPLVGVASTSEDDEGDNDEGSGGSETA